MTKPVSGDTTSPDLMLAQPLLAVRIFSTAVRAVMGRAAIRNISSAEVYGEKRFDEPATGDTGFKVFHAVDRPGSPVHTA